MHRSNGVSRCSVNFVGATVVTLLATIATAGADQRDDENSYDAWAELFSAMNSEWDTFGNRSFLTPAEEDLYIEYTFGPIRAPNAAESAVFEKIDAIAPLLRNAAGAPEFAAPLDREAGWGMLLPHLSMMRQSTRLGIALSRRAIALGEHAEAIDWLGTLATFSAHPGQDDVLISSLVGTAMFRTTDRAIDDFLTMGMLDQAGALQLLEKLQGLAGSDDPFRFTAAIEGEWGLLDGTLEGFSDGLGADEIDVVNMIGGGTERAIQEILAAGNDPGLSRIREEADVLFGRVSAAMADPDRVRGVETLREIEAELQSESTSPLLRLVFPSLSRAAEVRMKAERQLEDRIRGLEAVASGRLTPGALRNAAIVWLDMGQKITDLSVPVQIAGEELLHDWTLGGDAPDLSESARKLWEDGGGLIGTDILQSGLDAATIPSADFSIGNRSEPSLDHDRFLVFLRAVERSLLADAVIHLERARLAEVSALDSTEETRSIVLRELETAAQEIAVVLSLAADLIADPTLTQVVLASGMIEDVWTVLQSDASLGLRENVGPRLILVQAMTGVPRSNGLDVAEAATRDTARFVARKTRGVMAEAGERLTEQLETMTPDRRFMLFSRAEGRVRMNPDERATSQAKATLLGSIAMLFSMQAVEDTQASASGDFDQIWAQCLKNPSAAASILGPLQQNLPLEIRAAAERALVQIVNLDRFCRAPSPLAPIAP
ncbi:MAG: hypothetical protein O3A31_11630 [Planctomycetota bacterium]|nr:hypothetical protein [Planctomycetota bacterium]